jgi:DNA-binding GntR family transcriptional regulator
MSSPRRGEPVAEVVYRHVRDAIVEGAYSPDSQLVQEQIADELGVSRTPVREALNRLAAEGVVTWVPRSGYTVNGLADADITDVFEVRQSLELLALRRACGQLGRTQAARLRVLIAEMDEADSTDAAAQFELNRRFHQAMIEPCGNRYLLGVLDQLWSNPVSRRITGSYIHDARNVARMVHEHEQILQASLDDDLETLLRLSTQHMTQGYGDARQRSSGPDESNDSSESTDSDQPGVRVVS